MAFGSPTMTKVPPQRYNFGSTMFASARAFASSATPKLISRIASPDLRPATPLNRFWRKASNEKAPPQIRNHVAPEFRTKGSFWIKVLILVH
jgi:hypothetical protein